MLSIPAASSFVLGPSKSVQERVAPGAPIYISSLGQTYRDPKFYHHFSHLPRREQRRFLSSQRELIARVERALAEYETQAYGA